METWIRQIKLIEKYETANCSLRQGDEEVNKRIRQKYIYLNKKWAICLNIYLTGFDKRCLQKFQVRFNNLTLEANKN